VLEGDPGRMFLDARQLAVRMRSRFTIGLFFRPGGSRPPTTNIYNDYINS